MQNVLLTKDTGEYPWGSERVAGVHDGWGGKGGSHSTVKHSTTPCYYLGKRKLGGGGFLAFRARARKGGTNG